MTQKDVQHVWMPSHDGKGLLQILQPCAGLTPINMHVFHCAFDYIAIPKVPISRQKTTTLAVVMNHFSGSRVQQVASPL